MPATPQDVLISLYSFEDSIEPAVVSALTALSVPACRQRSPGDLSTPRVEVALWMGAPTGKQYVPTGAVYSPLQTYPSAYHARLVLTTVTNRKGGPTNAGRHTELLGKSRLVMLLAQSLVYPLLTLHRICLIKDAGVHPAVEKNADLDISPLIFDVVLEIHPDAWPVLTP